MLQHPCKKIRNKQCNKYLNIYKIIIQENNFINVNLYCSLIQFFCAINILIVNLIVQNKTKIFVDIHTYKFILNLHKCVHEKNTEQLYKLKVLNFF